MSQKQASLVRGKNGKLKLKVRNWRTADKRPAVVDTRGNPVERRSDLFRRWGIVTDGLWEPGKIMVDIDDEKNICSVRKGHDGSVRRAMAKKSLSRSMRKIVNERGIQIPLGSLCHITGLSVEWIRWDRTQHGWHVTIQVRQKLTLAETIAAQAILGSDTKREMLNLARCISLRKRPSRYWEARANILYSRKVKHD